MITIIDYGLGNICAVANVYKRLNIPVTVAQTAPQLANASKLILPGVGAFDYAMQRLNDSGMRESITRLVLHDKVPILGICVGMQMLASSSDEGKLPGLDWIAGRVRKMDKFSSSTSLLLPHMGWNDVRSETGNQLFTQLEHDSRFYFLHSYYYECDERAHAIASTEYGEQFACVINKENIYGVQFHPEKSHHYGAQLLNNFADL